MAVKAAFEAQEARVLRKLRAASTRKGTRHWDYGADFDPAREKKAIDPSKVFNLEAETAAFTEAAFPPIENIYQSFGAGTGAALGVAFNLRDPAVAADILERSNRLARTTETTWNKVQEAIIDGEAEGETIDGIQKRIGRVFTQAKGYRSRVIARTETVGAMNAGSLRAADQSGVVEKKVWLAAVDHRTRSTHVSADGQAVEVKAKFAVGAARMDHPGDPAGGASEVVNCRCSMIFKRIEADAPDVALAEITEPDPMDRYLTPSRNEVQAALRARAAELRAVRPIDPGATVEGRIQANIAHEANLRDLGRQIREEAARRTGDVTLDVEKQEALETQIKALRDERWNVKMHDFGHGTDPTTGVEYAHQIKEGASRIDAYKKYRSKLERDVKAVRAELAKVVSAPKEARGRAALEVLQEVREMGVDPKAIKFETGSATAAKDAVKEMSEWYPAEWWEKSQGAVNPIQAKTSDGRGYYSASYGEKSKGTYRYVSRLVTTARGGDYRTTTLHELGHRMEHVHDDLTNLELRFWRRRTEDGNGFGGMRTYRYGKSSEVVNPDEFGDEYMGKSYMDRHSTIVKRERGVYDSASLDALESNDMAKTTSFEVLTMGMEELAFNHFRSWDQDTDYIDFILGVLAGV